MSRVSFALILSITVAPVGLTFAQQVSPAPPTNAIAAPKSLPAPAAPVAPQPTAPPATSADVTVNIGGASGRPDSGLAPLPKVDLPPEMIVPPAAPSIPAPKTPAPKTPEPKTLAPIPPPMAKATPPTKLTPAQIAAQIAPNFNVTRDYVRLTQCYGTADFMGAVTRIQAARPGATSQVIGVARTISALQDGMQPMVLAASTVRGEARFRADYDAIARRGQSELASSRTPNVIMQRRLATLDACRADVIRWRGQR